MNGNRVRVERDTDGDGMPNDITINTFERVGFGWVITRAMP